MGSITRTWRRLRGQHSSAPSYDCCRSERELLGTLGDAISDSARDIALAVRPPGCGRLALLVMKSFSPTNYAHHSMVRARLLSESIVFVAGRIREVLAELCEHGDADYLYREAATCAGASMATAANMTPDEAGEFTRTLSHVLLQHAHFPPSDDDQALVRLVASRERKLTVAEAVRVLRKLMGLDPLMRTEPWAFARSLQLLRGDSWDAVASV